MFYRSLWIPAAFGLSVSAMAWDVLNDEDDRMFIAEIDRGRPIQFTINGVFTYLAVTHSKLNWVTTPLPLRTREVIEVRDVSGWRVLRDEVVPRGIRRHDILVPYGRQTYDYSSRRLMMRVTYYPLESSREHSWRVGVSKVRLGVAF